MGSPRCQLKAFSELLRFPRSPAPDARMAFLRHVKVPRSPGLPDVPTSPPAENRTLIPGDHLGCLQTRPLVAGPPCRWRVRSPDGPVASPHGGEVRKNDPAHGGSASGALFAERHVYMRSGAESRYVVLTRPLQIGVVIGGALILAALAFAGGSAIVSRLAAIEQRREIARLEMVVQTLRTAAADQDAAAAGLRAGPAPQAAGGTRRRRGPAIGCCGRGRGARWHPGGDREARPAVVGARA